MRKTLFTRFVHYAFAIVARSLPYRRPMPTHRPLPPDLLTIPQAGLRFFGLGPAGSYAAAKRGDFVIMRIGSRDLVSVPGMQKRLLEGWMPERETRGGRRKSATTSVPDQSSIAAT
jgi:hypothetical protein